MSAEKEWFEGASVQEAPAGSSRLRADAEAEVMEIVTLRDPSWGDSTAGYVSVNGEHICHSIEDIVREPEGRPDGDDFATLERWVGGWKVPAKTAIASGRYPVTIDFSNKFKKRMIHIMRVPGFDGIRAHGGLTPEHSEGCPLLGDELYQAAAGWRVKDGKSKPAVDRLFEKIEAALAAGIEVWWTFKQNPNAEARV